MRKAILAIGIVVVLGLSACAAGDAGHQAVSLWPPNSNGGGGSGGGGGGQM
jgi:hypothetical protein